MTFNYHINAALPPLSWLLVVRKRSASASVYCGDKVDCNGDFFVAGVWDGKFSDGRFDAAKFVCCTGASVNNCKRGG